MRKHGQNVDGKVGLYQLGSIYPAVTGGMEIFNYYFLLHQLSVLHKRHFYWTSNELIGFEDLHVRIWGLRPIRIFHPMQLFFTLIRYRSRIGYVYTGYARQSWVIPFLSAVLFRLFKIPYVVTIHSGGKPNWKNPYLYRYYFKNARALVGVSEAICEDYGHLNQGKKIHYIPPLIPFERSLKSKVEIRKCLGIGSGQKVLLYVGTLKGMKNPDKILKALRFIGNTFLDFHQFKMVFAGNGEMLDELKQYVNENNLDNYVIFAGLIDRKSIPDYFAMADYYIISSDYEGTSVSLLEAMYNKLAVIAADSPGINSMVRANENALMYPKDDIQKLANCIIQYLTNPDECARLAESARANFYKNYSYSLMVENYEKLFNSVILAT